ncbi:OmpA family protein [Paraliomyxa miuraensis]|nr:OmpA family protein [Paraliomyxa miuraensis]
MGPERVRLEQLEERPVASPDTIGDILPEAFARASTTRQRVLALAVEPVMATAVRTVVRKDADFLGELLAPTIGAAVRKAVSEAIKAILQRFNEALERSLSVRSIRWRIEARRTGRPFAEVVLLHTLVYRVEQVFLIHPTTGLVLVHVADESCAVRDPDQVASMLEAIDAFVREAFRPQPPGVHLHHVEVGDLTVWVDRDASLAMAAVVRGVPPRALGEWLYEARQRVRLAYQPELERFRSDVSPFAPARSLLEPILRSARRPAPRRAHLWLMLLVAAIASLVGALVDRAIGQARLLDTYVDLLQAEPGIIVTSATRDGGHVRLEGLADPLASHPSDVLERRGLTAPELTFEPFSSLDPRIVERRAQQRLHPPAGVMLTLGDATLRAAGVAPRAWITQARSLALAVPGIERFDDQALRAEEADVEVREDVEEEARVAALRAAARALETTTLYFMRGSAELTPDAALDHARARWHALVTAADAAGLPICVAIVGHTDPTGSRRANQALSKARAAHVARALAMDDARVQIVGAGALHDARPLHRARRVTFWVDVGAGCPSPDGRRDD